MGVSYLCFKVKFELKLNNMKRIFWITGILISAALLLSSFSLRENPQDPPRGKKKEKHITVVKTDDNGNQMKLDTILTNDEVFVWNGDTISGGFNSWFSDGEFKLDSLLHGFDIDIDTDGENKVFVMKSGKQEPHVFSFNSDGDSTSEYRVEVRKSLSGDHDVMVWNDDNMEKHVIVAPGVPAAAPFPAIPGIHLSQSRSSENVIDLSDPGIISYKKKKMSNGREKITIIRNEVTEKDLKKIEEIIIDNKGNHSMIHGVEIPQIHKIIVHKNDDNNIEVEVEEEIQENN